MKDTTLGTLIEDAIQKEIEAYDFYQDLCARVDDPTARDTLLYVAEEEKKHREFLVRYRDGHMSSDSLPMETVVDYKIAESFHQPDLQPTMDSKEVYLVAAHREMAAHVLYQRLAQVQPDGNARDFFQKMSLEELRHKEKMEYLYANTAFPQTSGG